MNMRLCRSMTARVLTVVLAAALTTVGYVAVATVASAATATTCAPGAGGLGQEGKTICWIDFAGLNQTIGYGAAGQDFTVTLPSGYTATFTMNLNTVAGFNATSVCPNTQGIGLGQNYNVGGLPAVDFCANVNNGGFLVTLNN